ncbi:ribonuclease VapC [Planctomycetales bacterium]|nr:ribonuclease VapC [Planctomycetales bacterium]GHS99566.1 ribonuclease VapC [Planctomycetales bacterium]GHT07643.1 ribonuclease VapC [Planctomycetales bacterium]
MIVADTTVWIDFANGVIAPHTEILRKELTRREVATTDVIMVEFLQGFRDDESLLKAERLMNTLKYRPFWGKHHIRQAVDNYRFLRKRGVTVRNANDVIIGTFCLENNLPLLHNDRDFEPMEKFLGLQIVAR